MSNRKKRKLSLVNGSPDVIVISRNYGTNEDPFAVCTCGWQSEPNNDMLALGLSAMLHSEKTGHCLRKHDK